MTLKDPLEDIIVPITMKVPMPPLVDGQVSGIEGLLLERTKLAHFTKKEGGVP